MSLFDKGINTRFLGINAKGNACYTGEGKKDWAIGEVPNGGYVVSILLNAVLQHYSERYQTDPVALNCFFLRKTTVGPLIIEIQDIKPTRKGYCVSNAILRQAKDGKTVPKTIQEYESLDLVDKVYGMFTMGNMDAEKGPTFLYKNPDPPARSTLQPYQHRYMSTLTECEMDLSLFGQDRSVGSGKMECHQAIRFADGRNTDFAAIPLWCDMFAGPANGIGYNRLFGKDGMWGATMQLEIQFKAKPQTKGVLGSFITNNLINGRFDLDGWIWDDDGKLLATTRHQCLALPWNRNSPAKL